MYLEAAAKPFITHTESPDENWSATIGLGRRTDSERGEIDSETADDWPDTGRECRECYVPVESVEDSDHRESFRYRPTDNGRSNR